MDAPAEMRQIVIERFGGHVRRHVRHDWTHWRQFPFPVLVHVYSGLFHTQIDHEPEVVTGTGQTLVLPSHLRNRVASAAGCELVYTHTRFRVGPVADIFDQVAVARTIDGEASREIGLALERFETAWRGPWLPEERLLRLAQTQQYAMAIIQTMLSVSHPRDSGRGTAMHPAVMVVLELVERNLHRTLRRAELARTAGLSETRLSVVFQQSMGCAPMAWIERRRLERAQELLLTTPASVAEIAHRVGFADPFYFSRRFRQCFGRSPSTMRRQQADWLNLP